MLGQPDEAAHLQLVRTQDWTNLRSGFSSITRPANQYKAINLLYIQIFNKCDAK